MQLFTRVLLASTFSNYEKRLKCIEARLQATSILGIDIVLLLLADKLKSH